VTATPKETAGAEDHATRCPQVRHTCTVITYRLAEAAEILAVSDDTVRRWVDAGRLPSSRTAGRATVTGPDLADFAEQLVESGEVAERDRTRAGTVSARNRMSGIVTRVKRDHVMAQVEMICGPYRVVSLMSSDAADELGLEPGVRAIASVKSTNVVVEVPR
jgi:molybdopterin-binding protein